MNLLLLHLLANAMGERLVGATLGTPTWLRPVLSLPLREGRDTTHLVAVLETPGPIVFLTDAAPLEGTSERFGVLAGRRVTRVRQEPGDRVLCIEAGADTTGASDPLELHLHLYGARGSALLVRGQSTLESVGTRHRSGPPQSQASIVEADTIALGDAVAGSGVRPIQSVVSGLDDAFVAAFHTPDGGFDATAAGEFRDALLQRRTSFHLTTRRAVPIPLDAPGREASLGPFESAEDAARAVGEAALAEAEQAIIRSRSQPIRRRIASSQKLLENLHGDLAKASGHEQLRREAETLAAFQSTVPVGTDSVELHDVYDPDTTLVISLDPSLPIGTQVEKRFKRATKLEKSEAHARRRIKLVTAEIRELESALAGVEGCGAFAQALADLDTIMRRFDLRPKDRSAAKSAKAPTASATTHRRFEVGNGWFVLVGRNNRDNDELTFHTSAPADLWFHAQSVPGSHVVLKSSGAGAPPARVIEAAAAVAAHFSRARHSGLVPVIYTQRKYVRKFRGAKPGQVRCEREKMVMVAPKLPAEG